MKTSILLGTATGLLAALSAAPAMADPPTPVTCGNVITAPGEYVLASDCTGLGITIAASDVHLKLNGHTMTGLGIFTQVAGILAFSASDVHIEGPGTIQLYTHGIRFDTVTNSHVEQVTCIHTDTGLLLNPQTTNTHVDNNVFSMTDGGGPGIHCQNFTSDNHLNNNQTFSNTHDGILISPAATNYHVNGNTALGNIGFDLEDDNANCDANMWNGNTFVTANQPCIN